MTSEEQPQEENTPDPLEYIQGTIRHVREYTALGNTSIAEKNYVQAQEYFDNARNHYETRKKTLTQLKLTLCFPSLSEIDDEECDNDEILNTYNASATTLVGLVKELNTIREKNAPKAQSQSDLIQRKELIDAAKLEQGRLQQKLSEIGEKIVDLKNERIDTEINNDDDILGDSIEAALNMQVLAGFITALGVTAVAIAFTTLNLSGLAMPGVALAGFGLVTTMIGCSIFCSSAKNVDQYTDNIYKSFHTSTA